MEPENNNNEANQSPVSPGTPGSYTPPSNPVSPPPAPAPVSPPPIYTPASTPVVAPAPATPPPPAENPGKTLGVVGLIFAFLAPLIGLILSIIGLNKSKKAGFSNGTALAGIIISIIAMIIGTIVFFTVFLGAMGAVQSHMEKCQELGPGVHYVDGQSYDCTVE